FCAIFTLVEAWDELDAAIKSGSCEAFFEGLRVPEESAAQCLYLCDFYFANTIPFLEIVSEQDKLSGGRKIVEILVNKYNGKARHSQLMNTSQMKKREFRETIESLIDREAITVETYRSSQGNPGRMYVLSPHIIESWNK
ncbi:MAG: hypothetical protein LHW57_01865, partial [Candidatus Cloacimonetes bacterium]|nr:hypothetical protein [Candidatus Cloacimonadota bacterium]